MSLVLYLQGYGWSCIELSITTPCKVEGVLNSVEYRGNGWKGAGGAVKVCNHINFAV